MRRILLTGKNGQVGFELHRVLSPLGEVFAFDRTELDLASPDAIRQRVREVKPQIIVNAAAYAAVDQAESESDLAMKVNGVAPGVLAGEAKRLGALMIHYSTDYVFDGTKSEPYTETDTPTPLSVYGQTKLAGDQAIQVSGASYYIFRTSWVYAARGQNFLRTMLRRGRERQELRIVNDQIGAPTWARFLADVTVQVLREAARTPTRTREKCGLYNVTAFGSTSWFGFAEAIFAEARKILGTKTPKLLPIPSSEYRVPARRPAYSCLDNSKLRETFGLESPSWETMLRICMRDVVTLIGNAPPET